MTGKKTLVAYVTKGGATEEYAAAIAGVLRNKHKLEVDVVNLRKNSPDISQYSNIIVGSGIRAGKTYSEFDSFMRRDFGGRRVAVFFASGEAGNPKSYPDFVEKRIKPLGEKYPSAKIISAEGFGGRIKILFKVVDDSRDMKKAEAWAEKIGKLLGR